MSHGTVLVVDGEPLIRWSVGERMRAEGYDVVEAGTGRAALDQFGPGVDVVLLDSRLPDVDGVSILAGLLKRKPDLRVIFMTADSNVAQPAQTLDPGRFQVASKPFLLDDLVAMVRGATDGRAFERGRKALRDDTSAEPTPA